MWPCCADEQTPCPSPCHLMQDSCKGLQASCNTRWRCAHSSSASCTARQIKRGALLQGPNQSMHLERMPARQDIGTNSYRGQVVLVSQREGFGLCGTVPNALFVDAWSEADDGRKADFLVADHDDIFNNISRINAYSMSTSQAAPLPACPGTVFVSHAPL